MRDEQVRGLPGCECQRRGQCLQLITNSDTGVIDIHAVANASAGYGSAYANAALQDGIDQNALALAAATLRTR